MKVPFCIIGGRVNGTGNWQLVLGVRFFGRTCFKPVFLRLLLIIDHEKLYGTLCDQCCGSNADRDPTYKKLNMAAARLLSFSKLFLRNPTVRIVLTEFDRKKLNG
jgi:hypothetical protein